MRLTLALFFVPQMQKTHFAAHARNHGILTKKTWGGWLVHMGQVRRAP